MLYFKIYPFTLFKQSRSFTFLFIYLGEQFQYYQSSNNVPQSAHTLDFDLKYCFVLLNTSSRSTRCWLASVSLFVALVCLGPRVVLLVVDLSPSQTLLLWFGCLGPRVALLVVVLSPSIFHRFCVAQHLELLCSFLTCPRLNLSFLFCSTPRVALLVVDMSPSQSLPLWFAQNLELICWLLTQCLDSRDSLFQPFVLCVENSTRSACCSVVSGGYLLLDWFL